MKVIFEAINFKGSSIFVITERRLIRSLAVVLHEIQCVA
jgi:hypothetical protein